VTYVSVALAEHTGRVTKPFPAEIDPTGLIRRIG
jgi:hypothetical protein